MYTYICLLEKKFDKNLSIRIASGELMFCFQITAAAFTLPNTAATTSEFNGCWRDRAQSLGNFRQKSLIPFSDTD